MNKKQIFTLCLIIYLIVVFVTEIFYRNKLYDKSVEYIENIRQDGFFHYFYFFWSNIFLYGMLALGILITYFCFSINIFFCHLSALLILLFITSLLKSLYTSSRPFWDIYDKYLLPENNSTKIQYPTECEAEFGNPSGHALLATFILIIWDLFINSHLFKKLEGKKHLIIKYITLVISIICIIFTIYSRINRQIHSFNQILFGTLLGLAIYFTYCHILELNKINTNIFFENLNKYKYILISIIFILYTISVILGLTMHNKNEKRYESILIKYCGYNKKIMFGKNTAYSSSFVLIIIGSYLGLIFLKYKINKNYSQKEKKFYDWNKGSLLKMIKIFFCSMILPAIFGVPIFFVSFDYYSLKFILTALFCLFYGFCLLGLCFYYACAIFDGKKDEEEEITIGLIGNDQEMYIHTTENIDL